MKKVILLPKEIGLRHPRWFYAALEAIHTQKEVILNGYSESERITPAGQALIELLLWEARAKRVAVKGLGTQNLKVPLHQSGFSIDWFERSLKPLFFDRFIELSGGAMSEDRRYELSLLFNELTQNALDHSGSEKFLVVLETDAVGVFDLGVGIPAKLEQSYPAVEDVLAIERALEKGVTTRRERSGGFGLYFTLEQLKENGGYLFVASRNGQIRRYLKNKKVDRKVLPEPMTGTLIYCSLPPEKARNA
jgi:hypothetical protein